MKNTILEISKALSAVLLAGTIFLLVYNYYSVAGFYCIISSAVIYIAFFPNRKLIVFRAILFLLMYAAIISLYSYSSILFFIEGKSLPNHKFVYDGITVFCYCVPLLSCIFDIKNALE